MPIIVGYTTKPEGKAALQHALTEARAHGESLVVVNIGTGPHPENTLAGEEDLAEVSRMLKATGIEHQVRQLVRGKEPSQEIVDLADEIGATMIVIGLRRRSPVGKLLLGSNAQQILLDASCPVVAVKA
ncbi:universal stress protein [Pengzhenrongella frigida]|uniref:Universal stress protein n=1 Tax=Pengzhenrongella frigida TaxID=1259133 RepID=A0A4Q5N4G5_9MICO|nr:universal stress protein [Cellulomonas sp. HLT2-17]RYV51577.1 universal stress protein [Cellulomonas sp. HLT2-17]